VHHHAGVQIDLEALPDDPETLQQMLREVVPELLAENEKLWLMVQRMLRHRYGPRSEKLDLDQLLLGLEDAEQGAAEREAAKDAAEGLERRRRIQPANRNRGALPAHLPRDEALVFVGAGTIARVGTSATNATAVRPRAPCCSAQKPPRSSQPFASSRGYQDK
jgi:hypothetical protein